MSVDDAIDTLRYLRDEAATHTFISTWTVVELVDAALEALTHEKALALQATVEGMAPKKDADSMHRQGTQR